MLERQTPIREFVVSFVDGSFNLRQRFLRFGEGILSNRPRIFPRMNECRRSIREFVALFVDGSFNLRQRFLR